MCKPIRQCNMMLKYNIKNLKYFEGSSCGLIKVLSQHLPRGTEENHKILS
jgi:hypothetical protein